MVATYAPMFLLFAVGLVVALAMFAGGTFFGPKNPTPEKLMPFECGSESAGGKHTKLSVKFYLTAILFVVFDIEAIFIYPWAVTFRELGWVGFMTMLSFLAVLVVGLVYCWKKGALEWETLPPGCLKALSRALRPPSLNRCWPGRASTRCFSTRS